MTLNPVQQLDIYGPDRCDTLTVEQARVLSSLMPKDLRDDFAARPMDYPLCIKEKSWPVLAGRFPELADLPIYQRRAFRVRYLSPRPSATGTDWRPIAAFVFPRLETRLV